MNAEQFEALVARLDTEQARDPARHRRKVVLLALGVTVPGSLLVVCVSEPAIRSSSDVWRRWPAHASYEPRCEPFALGDTNVSGSGN
jgi:hypothetical protein